MDKYSATWISHSRIHDFRACPRSFFLKYVYKDPRTNHKLALVTPSLTLGSAVHEVLESLSVLPAQLRFQESPVSKFKLVWTKYAGIKGGFSNEAEEDKYRQRGEAMIRRVMAHPGPLSALAVKIKTDLPYFWLSPEDGIILSGKIDWLEYDSIDDSVKILDFKTGNNEEQPDSLQLPIYYLLAVNCQPRRVTGASYWYLAKDDFPRTQVLPDITKAREIILKYAKSIKLAITLDRFKCPTGDGGCHDCRPFEKILQGEATFVRLDEYGRDVYTLAHNSPDALPESEVL